MLEYYDSLSKKYRLPGRQFLEYERDCYRKYIKMLKNVSRVLVEKAKAQARETAKMTIINHTGTARANFDKEIIHILEVFEIDVREQK